MWQYARVQEGYRFRTDEDGLPPTSRFIALPHELDAHHARKYTTSWIGYKCTSRKRARTGRRP